MILKARVLVYSTGNLVVICSSPTPIQAHQQQPILAEITKAYAPDCWLFLTHGVIAIVHKGKPQRRGRI